MSTFKIANAVLAVATGNPAVALTILAEYAQSVSGTGEWTPEEEQAFDARINALRGPNKPDHWKTDEELGLPPV